MTYQPGHSHHPHTRFARACDRLSRGLAWVYDHTWPRREEEESAWCAQCDEDTGSCTCEEFCGRVVCMAELDDLSGSCEDPDCRDGSCGQCDCACHWPDDRHPEDVPGSVTRSAGGPGYIHDDAAACDDCHHHPRDPRVRVICECPCHGRTAGPAHFHDHAPAEYVPAVQLSDGSYAGLKGTIALDDTMTDWRPEPRAGAPAWTTQLRRDRTETTWVDELIQSVLGVPTVELYMWGWQQRRAIAA